MTHWITTMAQGTLRGVHWVADSAPGPAAPLPAWLHEGSLTALAAAVITLGVVMLLELRSLARLRRTVDTNLSRVFEQLDLLRFDQAQLLEAQTPHGGRALPPAVAAAPVAMAPVAEGARRVGAIEEGSRLGRSAAESLATGGSQPLVAPEPRSAARIAGALLGGGASLGAVAAGEARLLAALAQARARRAEAIHALPASPAVASSAVR